MTRRYPKGWPSEGIELLLKACILADDDQAREAWHRWTARRDFDGVSRHEMRLLSALSVRLGALDPDSPLRPRVEGLARAHWTQTQLVLAKSLPALARLDAAGIPHMVFKGAAQYAEGLAAKTRRILGDLDILVPSDMIRPALSALVADDWAGVNGDADAYLDAVADLRVGINLVRGRHGEIDLHRTPFHIAARDVTADRALWAGVRVGHLLGRPVSVASPAANTVITLAHATHSPGGDWAVDVAARLGHQAIDWDELVMLAERWRLVLPVAAGLGYLRGVLDQPVPAGVVERLAAAPASALDHMQFWGGLRLRDRHNPVPRQLVARAATAVQARQGYVVAPSDRTRLLIARPSRLARLLARALSGAPPPWRASVAVPVPAGDPRFVVIDLEAERPASRRRLHIDLFTDGRLFGRLRATVAPGAGPVRLTSTIELPPGRHTLLTILSLPTRPGGEGAARAVGLGRVAVRAADLPLVLAAHFFRRFKINPPRRAITRAATEAGGADHGLLQAGE